jgi:Plant specific eukaryotic initiation factor 4B
LSCCQKAAGQPSGGGDSGTPVVVFAVTDLLFFVVRASKQQDVLSRLPTAPRARSDDEPEDRGLGGAFNNYGGGRGRERESGGAVKADLFRAFLPRRATIGAAPTDQGWSVATGFGRERDGDREEREDLGPSRADESDNWGATRKFVASGGERHGGGYERSRGGGFGGRDREYAGSAHGSSQDGDRGPSRADESDNWARDRKPVEPAGRGFEASDRRGGYERRGGGGFDDAPRRRDEYESPSRADEADKWAPRGDGAGGSGFGGGGYREREAPRADSEDRWRARRAPSDGAASAAGGGRPRLQLAPRTKPVSPDPTPELAPAATKSNPFGAARPREDVLKEQVRPRRFGARVAAEGRSSLSAPGRRQVVHCQRRRPASDEL